MGVLAQRVAAQQPLGDGDRLRGLAGGLQPAGEAVQRGDLQATQALALAVQPLVSLKGRRGVKGSALVG